MKASLCFCPFRFNSLWQSFFYTISVKQFFMALDKQTQLLIYAIAKCRAENKIILGYLIGSIAENYPGFSAFLQKKITKEIAAETEQQWDQMLSAYQVYDPGTSNENLIEMLLGSLKINKG